MNNLWIIYEYGWWFHPLWKIISWDDEIPNIWKKTRHVPVTTNQFISGFPIKTSIHFGDFPAMELITPEGIFPSESSSKLPAVPCLDTLCSWWRQWQSATGPVGFFRWRNFGDCDPCVPCGSENDGFVPLSAKNDDSNSENHDDYICIYIWWFILMKPWIKVGTLYVQTNPRVQK